MEALCDLQCDPGFVWRVLHVKPRCEKKMAEICLLKHIRHYLPLRKKTGVYQRRKVVVEKPLFPSYVFVSFNEDQRIELLKTNYIVRIIEVRDQERLVGELASIRLALAADPALNPCSIVTRGTMVRVIAGPFAGVEGVVEKTKTGERVILNVLSIGQGVAMEVGSDLLEKI